MAVPREAEKSRKAFAEGRLQRIDFFFGGDFPRTSPVVRDLHFAYAR